MSLHAYCQTIADKLVAADIRATTDPARLSPPCVLVVPQEGAMTTLDGASSRTVFVMHLLASGQGGKNSMNQLSDLLGRVVAANVAPVQTWRLTNYDTDGGDPIPAFDLEWVDSVDVVSP